MLKIIFLCLLNLFTPTLLLAQRGGENKNKRTQIYTKQEMKSIEELISTQENGIDLVKEWVSTGTNKIELLPCDREKAREALYLAQVTTRSPMGAIIYETGGILINDGWLRILGSGHPRLDRSLPEWNKGKSFTEYGEQPVFFLIADDIAGGFFAINGGGISAEELGIVFYFAPDTMEWESTEKGFSDFLYWCFFGDLNLYYSTFQWQGYDKDLKTISGTQGVSFVPALWSKEGKDVNMTDRKIVPIEELWQLSFNTPK